MTSLINGPARIGRLADEVAALATRVGKSVVVVRGPRSGSGSGVIWNEHGLIVTNHHVVPTKQAEIVLKNDTRLVARVTLRDRNLDLAALRIEESIPADGLVPATIGDSAHLRVGEVVLAVGNPLGERNAVTLGVVSGTSVTASPRGSREVIQAAITLQPGNSGGALVDVRGRVVGIPHMVVGNGLALAVPSHTVERFLAQELGRRAFFGLSGRWVELPPQLVDRYRLSGQSGMLLIGVVPDSPAEHAGLTIGDIVVDLTDSTGRASAEPIDLLARLHRAAIDQPVRLAIIRGGELRWFEATPQAA